jgi:hypothetical protein
VPSPEGAPATVVAIDGDSRAWNEFVAGHPDATPYHSRAWRLLLESSFGYRAWSLMALDSDTQQASGVLPLFLVKSPFGRRLVAVPFRDRGGPLWTDRSAFVALIDETRRIAAEVGAASIELKSVESYASDLVTRAGLEERRYWIRSVIPLAQFAGQSLDERLGAKRRSPIRQAQESGIVCDDAGVDAHVWYDLHLQTQQRLGLPPFPFKFFRNLLHTLVPAGAAKLLIARHQGRALAATILLRHGTSVIYGYAASTAEGQRRAAPDVVLYTALTSAIAEGRAVFDMGSDAPAQSGLLFFKKRWFAEQSEIPTYRVGPPARVEADSSSPRYRALRAGFRYLPRPILRMTAGMTKYCG